MLKQNPKNKRRRGRKPRHIEVPAIVEVPFVREINARNAETVFMSYSIPTKSAKQRETLRHRSVVRHYGDHTRALLAR